MSCPSCLSSPTVDCLSYTDTHCVTYSGSALPSLGVLTNDRLDQILGKIDARVGALTTSPTIIHGGTGIILTGNGSLSQPYIVSAGQISWSQLTGVPNLLASFQEQDPVFTASAAFTITSTLISDWNQAFLWGNHALAGYIKGFTEVDPTVPAYVKQIPQGSNQTFFLHWDGTTYVPGPITWDEIYNKPSFSVYTDLQAQSAVGRILQNSASVNLYYTAGTSIAAQVNDGYVNNLITQNINSLRGVPGGLAVLGNDARIPTSELSAVLLNNVYVVNTIADRNALTNLHSGDVAKVLDAGSGLPANYIYNGFSWIQLSDNFPVTSVNSKTGVVVLSTTDIQEGTRLYYTDPRVESKVVSLIQAGTGVQLNYDSTAHTLTISATAGSLPPQLTTTAPLAYNSTTGALSIQQASTTQPGYLSFQDWNTFNNKIGPSRTLSINGVVQDLSQNRSWSFPDTNFSNTNLTFPGDRAHNLNGHSLTLFQGSASLYFSTTSLSLSAPAGNLQLPALTTGAGTDDILTITAQNQVRRVAQSSISGTVSVNLSNGLAWDSVAHLGTLGGLLTHDTEIGYNTHLCTFRDDLHGSLQLTGGYLRQDHLEGTMSSFLQVDSGLEFSASDGTVGTDFYTRLAGSLYSYADSAQPLNNSQFAVDTAITFNQASGRYYFSNIVTGSTGTDSLLLLGAGGQLKQAPYVPTDAYTRAQVDNFFSGTTATAGYNNAHWNTAYNKFPTALSITGTTTKTLTLSLNDGSSLTGSFTDLTGSGGNPYVTAAAFNTTSGVLTLTRNDLATITTSLDGRYLTSFTETDPVFTASVAHGITSGNLTNWNLAYNKFPTAASVVGGSSKTLTITLNDGSTLTAPFTDLTGSGGGSGTVTSVGLSMPAGLTVTGSPVTTSGTLTVSTTLSGVVTANGSGFSTATIGAGLSYAAGTLSCTITNNNQLSNGNNYISNITSLIQAGANITITGSGTSGSPYVINGAAGGGATGITSGYAFTSDGTNTTAASGSDTLRVRSANTILTVVATNNDATFGDNLLFTVDDTKVNYNHLLNLPVIPTNNNQLANGSQYITLVSLSGTAPITYNNATGAIGISQATTSTNGYLSSTDWNTFNQKVATTRQVNGQYSIQGGGDLSINRTLNLVGDIATPGADMLYGTDGSGTRTWRAIPTANNYPTAVSLGSDGTVIISRSGLANINSAPASGTWGINITGNAATANSAAALSTNLPVTNLNGGSGATTATFWRGDATWSNVLTNGSSTSGTAYLTFLPNDYGVGKPEFFFQKSTIASRWDMVLWDGATNNGTINFVSSALTWNGLGVLIGSGTAGQIPVWNGTQYLQNSNQYYISNGGASRFGFNTGSPSAIVQSETPSTESYFKGTKTGTPMFEVYNNGGIWSANLNDSSGVARMAIVTNGQLGYQNIISYSFAQSLVNTSGTVTLVGDSTTPAALNYYGTDSGGAKGYHAFPSFATGVTAGVGIAVVNSSNSYQVANNAYDDYNQWTTSLTGSGGSDNHFLALSDGFAYNIEIDAVAYSQAGDSFHTHNLYALKRVAGTSSLVTSGSIFSNAGTLFSIYGGAFTGSVQGANFQLHVSNGTYTNTSSWKVIYKVNRISILS